MIALLRKDLKNLKNNFWAALLLGLPLFLILAIANQAEPEQQAPWRTAFWLCLFFASTSIFYRSFSSENRSQNFGAYTALNIAPWKLLLSQSFVNWLSFLMIGCTYLVFTLVWWSPRDLQWLSFAPIIALTGLALAPCGSLLGLLLQREREVLFPLFYLPFVTPVVIGAHSLSLDPASAWLYILSIFALGGTFISFFVFQFFFDELTEVE